MRDIDVIKKIKEIPDNLEGRFEEVESKFSEFEERIEKDIESKIDEIEEKVDSLEEEIRESLGDDFKDFGTKIEKLSKEVGEMQDGLMDIYIELLLLQDITQKGMKYNVFYENFETIDDIELVSGAYNKENNYIHM